MSKLCLKYNIPSKYREAIYKAIDNEYDCDWYFGSSTAGIKEMDVGLLNNTHRYRTIGVKNRIYWNYGEIRLLFNKAYNTYFTLFESRCVTDWLFFAMAFVFFKKKRFYVWTHGWYGKESFFEAKMKLWILRNVTGAFVYGERAKELLINQGISSEKIFTIHNSLDYCQQKQIRESLEDSTVYVDYFGNTDPTLIFIGRLTKVKQLNLLIEAVANLRKKGELYNLVIVGNGEEKQYLIDFAKQNEIYDNIWFYGECYDERINAELIYNADLCVAPGNIGLTAIHSLMFGCPAISHNDFSWQMPEFEAIIPGKTGDFFTRNDIESLSSTISKWFIYKKGQRASVRQSCYEEIDKNWTPFFQMKVIKQNLVVE